VSARQLRARLNRLTPPATAVIGQDRDRDRRRREELRGRKLLPAGLTELEKAEFLKLEALFCDEDRDHDRLFELSQKQFYAEIGRDQLTDEETRELAELHLLFPPDPEMAKACETFAAILREVDEQSPIKTREKCDQRENRWEA
jgi:hypothetical protein